MANTILSNSISNLATTAALNAKINEVKNKIPNITNLATTSDLTTVENKVKELVKIVKESGLNEKIKTSNKKRNKNISKIEAIKSRAR